jgi:SEC-C motif-containing protein
VRQATRVTGIIDSGWAAWLPLELTAALEALAGGSPARRAFRDRLAAGPDPISAERWERFRLVAPSRIDVPATADGLTADECYTLLEELGLVAGSPPRPVPAEAVELVLTLDHDEVRELEQLRAARAVDGAGGGDLSALPSLTDTFGKDVGRNDPCPCGSGKKFKRCHGA